jgi:dTMP kinase
MIVIFEGIDGSGKTTQIALLHQYLTQLGHRSMIVSNPDDSGLNRPADLSLQADLLWHVTALRQINDRICYPATRQGYVVLLDRGYGSTLAYQGYGHNRINHVERIVRYQLSETMRNAPVILLDADPAIAENRCSPADRMLYLRNHGEFMRNVADGYLALADANDWHIVDADRSVEAVHESIKRIVDQILL